MSRLKMLAKKAGVLRPAMNVLGDKYRRMRLRSKSAEQVFTEIYEQNTWGGVESISGTGSDASQTQAVVKALTGLMADLAASSILDIPCGDFHWMKEVDLRGIQYTGADIVADLIETNRSSYGSNTLHFERLDLIRDRLPEVDLVFCRDCLVHLSYPDIRAALENICRSESKYLLTTSFVDRSENRDIATGQWRTLNLAEPPFSLPSPERVIREQCTEDSGAYQDKALVLWRISDIRPCVESRLD